MVVPVALLADMPVSGILPGAAMNDLPRRQPQSRRLGVAIDDPGEHSRPGQVGNEVRTGRGQDPRRRPLLHHSAPVQDDDVLGQCRQVQDVMGHQEQCQSLLGAPARHQAAHLLTGGDVQGGHRLIQDQQAGARCQRPGQRHPGRLPS